MNVASFTDAAYEQALSALAAFTREPEKMKAAEGQSETAAIELKNVLQTNMEVLAAFPEYGAAWAGTLEGCSDYSGAALEKLIGRLEEETSELSGIK
ncbi:MAG: hypothetical protein LBR88_04100, partial [Zoogloeaceae bacterium]|nr:hypothetical protein [Zoogloeaceae bacterium]